MGHHRITVDILNAIEQQGLAEDIDEEYHLLNRKVQQCCRRDKKALLNQTCNEIQEHCNCGEASAVFSKVQQFTRTFKIKKDETAVWVCPGIRAVEEKTIEK